MRSRANPRILTETGSRTGAAESGWPRGRGVVFTCGRYFLWELIRLGEGKCSVPGECRGACKMTPCTRKMTPPLPPHTPNRPSLHLMLCFSPGTRFQCRSSYTIFFFFFFLFLQLMFFLSEILWNLTYRILLSLVLDCDAPPQRLLSLLQLSVK